MLDDADVDAAAAGIAAAGFYNAGQDCTAATRVIATPAAHDRFVDLLVREAHAKVVGGLDTPDADLGPLNSTAQLDRVAGFVGRIPSRAKVVAGGSRQGDEGFFFQPTVITGLDQGDEIVQQEVFGPVITVQRFERLRGGDHVRQRRSDYGLSSSVWTRDHARRCGCRRSSTSAASGSTRTFPLVAEMPHGGFKHSGYGKDLSTYSLDDYTRVKHVMSATE